MAKKSNAEKSSSGVSPLRYFLMLLRGQVISVGFIMRYWLLLAVGIVFILIYITNKYTCQTSMERIQQLEQRLEVVNSEKMRERSLYMSRTTEISMQKRLDSLHLDLKIQEQPPFKLSDK